MREKCNTILLVESDPETQFVIQHTFNVANLPIYFQVVKDGQEAVDYLSSKKSDANRKSDSLPIMILSEINLPRKSGFELLTWVKQHPELKNLPVVVMSTYDDPNHLIQAASLGAYSYFLKMPPFDDLIEIVLNVLKTSSVIHDGLQSSSGSFKHNQFTEQKSA